jgi:hypothetical protein
VGGGRLLLRSLPRVPGVAGGAWARLGGDAPKETNAVPLGGCKNKIERLAERLPEDAWSEVLPAEDSGERRSWGWACLELAAEPQKGMGRWLLVRRDSNDPEDLAFYQDYTAPRIRPSRKW